MRLPLFSVPVCVLLALPAHAATPSPPIPSRNEATRNDSLHEHVDLIRIEAPHIIQQGDRARVAIRAAIPAARHAFARKMYLIVYDSARPIAASMTFNNNVGPITFNTHLALRKTTRVRGVVELSDGTRASVEQTIKVTRGGYIALSGSSVTPLPLNVTFSDSATQAALTDLLREVRGASWMGLR